MGLYGLFGLMGAGVVSGFFQWRYALYIMVLIAAIQDPVRKTIPGAPGYLVLATAPVLIAAIMGLVATRESWWRMFVRVFPRIGRALMLLLIATMPAALISAFYGPGSWKATLLGIFSYGVIVMSIVVGFYFARSHRDLRRLLGFYCVVSTVMLTGGLIEYLNLWPNSILIGTEAFDMEWIRHKPGLIVHMIAGFYRSPDVMGWHAAAVIMLALILAFSTIGKSRWIWIAIALAATVALLLCGRRKMVFMIPLFIVAVVWVYAMVGRKRQLITVLGLFLMPLASVAIVGDWLGDDSAQVEYYTSDPGDTVDRVYIHGFASLVTTYQQAGFWGSGLGFATPGSHHLQITRPRVWQESAPSRVLVELGVPGMLALLGVIITVMSAAWRVVRVHVRSGSPTAVYAAGLFAFFLSNVGSLVVSGQILADPFIAAFLGLSIGMVLSFGRAPFAVGVSRHAEQLSRGHAKALALGPGGRAAVPR